jgi:hypothetical protein
MSALKFNIADLIANPDDYTSNERKWAAEAVTELLAACTARDASGVRPSWSDIAVDCSGHLSAEAARHDAAQAGYFAALARFGSAP